MKKGILVGDFSEDDLDSKKDMEAVSRKQEETGLLYTNREIVKKNGRTFLRVWVCSLEDCEDFR